MSGNLRLCAVLAAAVLAASGWPAAAQETASREMSANEQKMMEVWTQYMTPGEPHAGLAQKAGTWAWTSTWWMQPGAAPETSSGTSEAEMVLGGRYLTEEIEGTAMGMPFQGQSLTGYDNHLKEYFSVWVDNMGTGVMVQRGAYDPATKTMTMSGTYDDPMDGKKKTLRSVTTYVDENTTRMEMYGPGPDGKEFKNFELVSKRTGA